MGRLSIERWTLSAPVFLAVILLGTSLPSAATSIATSPVSFRAPFSILTANVYPSNNTGGCETLTNSIPPWINGTSAQFGLGATGTASTCTSTTVHPTAVIAAQFVFGYTFVARAGTSHIRADFSNDVSARWNNSLGTCTLAFSSWSYCLAVSEVQLHQSLALTDLNTSQQYYPSHEVDRFWGSGWTYLCVYSNCTTSSYGNPTGHFSATGAHEFLTINGRTPVGDTFQLTITSDFWLFADADWYDESSGATTYTGWTATTSLNAKVTLQSFSIS